MYDRHVGIDLGVTSSHDVCVLDSEGNRLKHFRIQTTPSDLERLLAVVKDGQRAAFVLESCSMTYLPIAQYLANHGQDVFLVNAQKSYDLRRFYKRHTKTNVVDAFALAKMPLVNRESLLPFQPVSPEVFTLRRLTRQRQDFVERVTARMNRMRAVLQFLLPSLNLKKSTLFSVRGRKFLANADPVRIVTEGLEGQIQLWGDVETARTVWQSAMDTQAIYGAALTSLSQAGVQELSVEVEALEQEMSQVSRLNELIEETYAKEDPHGVLIDLVGLSVTTAAVVRAEIGSIRRFRNIRSFRGYAGTVPRRRASGDHDTEGLPATKNGNRRLRRALFMAASIARRGDPQLAEFFSRLTQRDKHYNKATMAAMNKLAGRIYAVLKREEAYKEARARGEQVDLERYVLQTPEGDPVAKDQARAMIAEHYPYRPKTKGQNPKGSEPSKTTEKGSLAARPLEAAS